jgi:dihydrofolate synthase/folylpolyglutamate synthase
MQTRMRGLQQAINCGMAMSVRQVLERSLALNTKKYTMGVRDAFLQGRLQVIERKNAAIVVLDGGHNEEASMQLAQNMRRLFPRQNKLFIVGILKRKDSRVVLQNILSVADTVIVTAPSSEYHSTEAMLSVVEDILAKKKETRNKKQGRGGPKILSSEIYGCPSLSAAIALADSLSEQNEVICIAGSFYLIGEYLKMH